MVRLVQKEWKIDIKIQDLYDMEESIIRMLDFDLHYCGPLPFLERYQRIYNLDQVTRDKEAFTINYFSRNFVRCLLRQKDYLSLKPS